MIDDKPLSKAEIEIIRKHRRAAERQTIEHQIVLHLLSTTKEFYKWLIDNEIGSSFSAFLIEFEYEENAVEFNGVYPDSSLIYKAILAIHQYAASQAPSIANKVEEVS